MYFLHEEDINFCFTEKCCNRAQLSNSDGQGRGPSQPQSPATLATWGRLAATSVAKDTQHPCPCHIPPTILRKSTVSLRLCSRSLGSGLRPLTPSTNHVRWSLHFRHLSGSPSLHHGDSQGCQPTEGSAHPEGEVLSRTLGGQYIPSCEGRGPTTASMAVWAHGSCLLTELYPSAAPDNLGVLWAAGAPEGPD